MKTKNNLYFINKSKKFKNEKTVVNLQTVYQIQYLKHTCWSSFTNENNEQLN